MTREEGWRRPAARWQGALIAVVFGAGWRWARRLKAAEGACAVGGVHAPAGASGSQSCEMVPMVGCARLQGFDWVCDCDVLPAAASGDGHAPTRVMSSPALDSLRCCNVEWQLGVHAAGVSMGGPTVLLRRATAT